MSLPDHVVIVSDAHLGVAPADTREAFHRFLATLPGRCGHLVINGDLFDFWFEYRSVIQREHFGTLVALSRLRESGIKVTVTGGNHDRWGIDFWERELEARFHRGPLSIELSGWNSWVVHGDGLAELRRSSRVTHALCAHPLTARTFRLLHPDLGHRIVRRIRKLLCAPRDDLAAIERAAAAQAEYARRFLAQHGDIDLLVMGHTHVPALESVGSAKWYLNPGAWMDGCRYAIVSADGPELLTFDG